MQFPDFPNLPKSALEVYELLMAKIEPDLLHANLPLLDEKYAKDTPKQREERKKRYQKAFKTFYAEMKKYYANQEQILKGFQHRVIGAVEQGVQEQEANQFLSSFDQAIEASLA
jgi:hypothetical protein